MKCILRDMSHKSYRFRSLALVIVVSTFVLGTLLDTALLHFFGFAVGGLGALIACVVAVWCAYRYSSEKVSRKSLVAMLKLSRPQLRSAKDVWLVVLTFTVMVCGLVYLIASDGSTFELSRLSGGLLLYAVSAALIPPFLEEMIDRGFIQSAFEKLEYGVVLVVVLSASIFSLSHFPTNPEVIPTAFAFGIAAGIITVRTRSVWIPFYLHAIWNFVIAIAVGIS